jgi:uncharacterized protein YdeI (YjbR/CyaY-like superfamily)
MAELPENAFHPLSRAAWRDWLEQHHERAAGVWLVSYKQGTGKPYVSYDEAVEEALCFGWVDSKPGKLDDERAMRYFAPRKARSGWSRLNKARVERLQAAGLMAPAGLARVEAARRDGSWNALDEVEELVVPADLGAALDAYPAARGHFAAFPRSVQRSILEWIGAAKTPATRAKRIAETASLAEENRRANQWRPGNKSG